MPVSPLQDHYHQSAAAGTAMDQEEDDDSDDDALCPICLCEMAREEGLTSCSSCHNCLHHHCMAIWTQECHSQGDSVVCPLCRAVWSPGAAAAAAAPPVTSRPAVVTSPTPPGSAYQYFAPCPYSAPGGTTAAATAGKAVVRSVVGSGQVSR
jgi:hypothetical protein